MGWEGSIGSLVHLCCDVTLDEWVCMSSLRFVICSIYPIVINLEIYLY